MRRWQLIGLVSLLAGCDGGAAEEAAKKAAEAKAAEEKAAEEKAAKRQAEREQKAAAEAEAAKAKQAAIEAMTVLPDKLPTKLDKACDGLVAAYDAYMRTVLEGDLKTKWETGGNEMQLKLQRVECKKRPVNVAACQTLALSRMKPEHEQDMGTIFTRCNEKFGGLGL